MADVQGKAVSQFTASTLAGTVLGMALTSFVDVSKLTHIVPCFFGLTAVHLGLVHISTFQIHEKYLNNQRANLLFDAYLKTGSFP